MTCLRKRTWPDLASHIRSVQSSNPPRARSRGDGCCGNKDASAWPRRARSKPRARILPRARRGLEGRVGRAGPAWLLGDTARAVSRRVRVRVREAQRCRCRASAVPARQRPTPRPRRRTVVAESSCAGLQGGELTRGRGVWRIEGTDLCVIGLICRVPGENRGEVGVTAERPV